MKMAVHLVYEGAERPFTAARVEDQSVARLVARKALSEASARAQAMRELDPVLAGVQGEEVERLRRVLGLLLPKLQARRASAGILKILSTAPGGERA